MLELATTKVMRFLRSEDGPTSVEYAVMLMLVVLAAITGIQFFGNALSGSLQNTSQEIQQATGN